jgi:hypothetical protein
MYLKYLVKKMERKIKWGLFVILFGVTLLFIGCSSDRELVKNDNLFKEEPLTLDGEIKIGDDGVKYLIPPNKIRSGGPPKGGIGLDKGIPALDKKNIKFISVQEADNWIDDNELVLALVYGGVKRVYPLQILVWHEIANDVVAGVPIVITYCPLCGSGIAYERTIKVRGENKVARFGTSGKLFNSNLIMYDDLTDTYWQQIDGKAIVGELTGEELVEISIDTVVWRDWKKAHPNSEILSQDTGMSRAYGKDPYGNYYENTFLIFPVENEDNRIHPKTIIFGIELNGKYKAYKEDDLKAVGVIDDNFNGVKIRVKRDEAGIVTIENKDSKEEIVKERDMWFAWYAFHPETELYKN